MGLWWQYLPVSLQSCAWDAVKETCWICCLDWLPLNPLLVIWKTWNQSVSKFEIRSAKKYLRRWKLQPPFLDINQSFYTNKSKVVKASFPRTWLQVHCGLTSIIFFSLDLLIYLQSTILTYSYHPYISLNYVLLFSCPELNTCLQYVWTHFFFIHSLQHLSDVDSLQLDTINIPFYILTIVKSYDIFHFWSAYNAYT